jgi:preprotein translocase subunit SecY
METSALSVTLVALVLHRIFNVTSIPQKHQPFAAVYKSINTTLFPVFLGNNFYLQSLINLQILRGRKTVEHRVR